MNKRASYILIVCFLSVLIFCQSAFAATLLRYGSRGNSVKDMQQRLKELGYLSGPVDGIFGRGTEAAVKRYQAANGLKVDGIAGSNTLDKLYSSSNSDPSDYPSNDEDPQSRGPSPIGRVLRRGSRGADVKQLQVQLNSLGFSCGIPDGIFGRATLGAVLNFQKSRGLKPDGIVGRNTISALFASGNTQTPVEDPVPITSVLKLGSRGSQVRALQARLNALGFSAGPADGIFGYGTLAAVKEFQGSKGLKADGIVGRNTIAALYPPQGGPPAQHEDTDTDPADGNSDEQPADRGDSEERPIFNPWKPDKGKISLVWDYRPSAMEIDSEGVNVVAPVWFVVKQVDGDVILSSMGASKAYVDAAHKNGYKVWATVQSFNPAYSKKVVQNQESGNRIIQKMVEAVQAYGLDGINIDFENMDPADKELYTTFVTRAVNSLHTVGATVSVDISKKTNSNSNWYSSCYDRSSLASVVDYVILMSYDEHWRTCPVNGPVASIGWVEQAIQVTLKEVPAQKLLMGVPLYAYDWISVPVKDNPDVNNSTHYKRVGEGVALTMDEIDKLIESHNAVLRSGETLQITQWLNQPAWLDETGTMYMKFVDTKGRIHELWYENSQAIAMKLSLVEKYNLAGAASWRYVFANNEIWDTYKEALEIE